MDIRDLSSHTLKMAYEQLKQLPSRHRSDEYKKLLDDWEMIINDVEFYEDHLEQILPKRKCWTSNGL